jgi:hypothetical protein
MRRARSLAFRTLGATKLLARDPRLPRPLRCVAAIGLMPIPGPVDEALLLTIAPIFMLFYRTPMRDAWEAAGRG